jgi:hypothetical protein
MSADPENTGAARHDLERATARVAGRVPTVAPRLPPFVSKVLKMLDTPELNELICWSPGGDSLLVKQPDTFAESILPKYFKHNNYSSFT